jgi:hypothetical protein
MSYNVTITANSLEELADKALALGGRLTLASIRPAAAVGAPEATYTPPVEVVSINPPIVVQHVSRAQVAPAEPAPAEPAPAEPAPAEPEVEIPDFNTVVSPAFLAFAETKGRDAAKALLSEFGAERVSLIDKSRWAELVATLTAARGA